MEHGKVERSIQESSCCLNKDEFPLTGVDNSQDQTDTAAACFSGNPFTFDGCCLISSSLVTLSGEGGYDLPLLRTRPLMLDISSVSFSNDSTVTCTPDQRHYIYV